MTEEHYFEWAKGGKLRYVEVENRRFTFISPIIGVRFKTTDELFDYIEHNLKYPKWSALEDTTEHESYSTRNIHS